MEELSFAEPLLNYLTIEKEILAQFASKGVQVYTGMEEHIGFGQFRGTFNQADHINGEYRDQAVEWLTQMLQKTKTSELHLPSNVVQAENLHEAVDPSSSNVLQLAVETQPNVNRIDQASAVEALPQRGRTDWPCRKIVSKKPFLRREAIDTARSRPAAELPCHLRHQLLGAVHRN